VIYVVPTADILEENRGSIRESEYILLMAADLWTKQIDLHSH